MTVTRLEVPPGGRRRPRQLRLTDPTVSRDHCSIRPTAKGPLLRDLGSTNGTCSRASRCARPSCRAARRWSSGTRRSASMRSTNPSSCRSPTGTLRPAVGAVGGDAAPVRAAGRVAASDVTVLIEGETGTGKERCARRSTRRAARGRPVRRRRLRRHPAQPDRDRAVRPREGRVHRRRPRARRRVRGGRRRHAVPRRDRRAAARLQPKLLRVLERARGAPRRRQRQPRTVDVRVIAATNRDLREEVNARQLPRRTSSTASRCCALRVPPLRERPEDIPLLVEHFRTLAQARRRRAAVRRKRRWRSFVAAPVAGQRARAAQRGRAAAVLDDVPFATPGAPDSRRRRRRRARRHRVPFKEAKERAHRRLRARLPDRAARGAGGNISQAAREAGIDRVYLLRLMGRYGLRKPRE